MKDESCYWKLREGLIARKWPLVGIASVALVIGAAWSLSLAHPIVATSATEPVHDREILRPERFNYYIERFDAGDGANPALFFANGQEWAMLSGNIPLLDCPDKELALTYYFRWLVFRKHLCRRSAGWFITEFLQSTPPTGQDMAYSRR